MLSINDSFITQGRDGSITIITKGTTVSELLSERDLSVLLATYESTRKILADRTRLQNKNRVLYNAISLLIDETFEQYDDAEEWFAMIQNELGCSAKELEENYGIRITVDGGLI